MAKANSFFAGKKVATERFDKGLTQAEFAKQLGISRGYLNYIENDQKPITSSLAQRLEKATGRAPDYWRQA